MRIVIAGAGIKHYWNLVDRGMKSKRQLPLSVAGPFRIALLTSPLAQRYDDIDLTEPVSFSEGEPIIQARCLQCHSATPGDPVWIAAPGGVKFDTPEEIQAQTEHIMRTTVRSNFMPLGNLTNMTEEERRTVHRWIRQGARIDR